MITLYTTHCPKCKVLEQKLKSKNILFTEVTDIEEMTKLGFAMAPVLEVDGKIMEFGEAIKWTNNYVGE
jgi:hypothetical protein